MSIGYPAIIDGNATRANRTAQHIRQIAKRRETFWSTHAASTGDDDLRISQIDRAFSFLEALDFGCDLIFAEDRCSADHFARFASICRRSRERAAAQRR